MRGPLVLEAVTLRRGGLTICRDVSLTAFPGQVTVILGANGTGKSTLLDGIAGVLPVSSGSIQLAGQRIDNLPPYRRAAAGLAYAEQGRSVFSRLTVAQNIGVVDRSKQALDRAFDLFPQLANKRGTRAGLLSGGEQQMLIIARSLITEPQILLVDELSLGLAPKIVRTLMQTLAEIASTGIGILLIEQFAKAALSIGTTAHVMQRGKIVHTAPCGELLLDQAALAAPYLSWRSPQPPAS